MPIASIDQIQMYYEVSPNAPADGPAVVFLHGLGSSSADWALQAPVFAGRRRVITLDLRGHGRSTGADTRFTVQRMADDVAGLLEQLGEPPAHVVGLSLGGCVALALALRRPERVRSLTLVNSFARLRLTGLRGLVRAAQRMWLLRFAPMSEVAAFVARGLFPRPEQQPYYEAALASLSRTSRQTYFAALRAIGGFDVDGQLDSLRCPTLIIAGDRDATVPLSAQHSLQRRIPGARLVVIPDSGHATPYDQTQRFNQEVLAFVEE